MKTASTEREAIVPVTGDALRPVLARLRRSSRYAVFGLAAITIAGCSEAEPTTWQCRVAGGETVTIRMDLASDPARTIGTWVDTNGWHWHFADLKVCRLIERDGQ